MNHWIRRLALFCALALVVSASAQEAPGRTSEILQLIGAHIDEHADDAFQRGDFPLTIQMLRARYELDTSNEEIANNLILVLRSVEDEVGALAVAMRFRESNPNNPDRGLSVAQWYWQMRQYTRIPKILEPDIYRNPPPHPNTFRLLGNAYDRMGFYADALRVWELALSVYPTDQTFANNVTKTKRKIGR